MKLPVPGDYLQEQRLSSANWRVCHSAAIPLADAAAADSAPLRSVFQLSVCGDVRRCEKGT